jgi:hypothetical protein
MATENWGIYRRGRKAEGAGGRVIEFIGDAPAKIRHASEPAIRTLPLLRSVAVWRSLLVHVAGLR